MGECKIGTRAGSATDQLLSMVEGLHSYNKPNRS
jgi:hypothetical protein